jgi:hypothetical protein
MTEQELNIGDTGYSTFDDRSKYSRIVEEDTYRLEDYKITKVLGDTILSQLVDETEEGLIKRGTLFVPQNEKTKDYFRFAKVILKGPKVSDMVSEGDLVIIAQASLQGVRGIQTSEGRFQFITEDRIFGVVEKKGV